MTLALPDFNSFDATVAALFSRVRGHIEPGAHRMQLLLPGAVLAAAHAIPTVLVAGTNGKGTTCSLIEQYLRNSGLRTGLYTSPHLVSPTERIRIDGQPISSEAFISSCRTVFAWAKKSLPDATFFELMTAIGIEMFVQQAIDVLVCEVGLGGRLDSTNVLKPNLSILTSVGLDHTEWLGDSLEQIAYEKSFVSRRNQPFLIGPLSEEATRGVNRAVAITGAQPTFLPATEQPHRISESLLAAAAHALGYIVKIRPTQEDLQRAQSTFFWPGRFDLRWVNNTRILFDAAHNSHGVDFFLARCLSEELSLSLPQPWTLVFATLADKDWPASLGKLVPHFAEIVFTQSKSERAVHPDKLMQYTLENLPESSVNRHLHAQDALTHGLTSTQASGGTLFVLGSITLLGEAMDFFAIPVFPPAGK